MTFGYIGIDCGRAEQDIRSLAAFTDSRKIDFLQCAQDLGIEQCMVLSTCNRSEVYYYGEDAAGTLQALYLRTFSQELLPYLSQAEGTDAIAHLFDVAAGQESMVLGEDQILGQVREAYELSRSLGCTGKELNRIVQDAVACAKKLKTALRISEKPLSVSYIGVKQLVERFGVAGRDALVVGSGHAAALALSYLYEYGASSVTVCSRNRAHADRLRQEFPLLAIEPFEKRYEIMEHCDLVVSATASPHLVIRREKVRLLRETAFLDLASPRDIDPGLRADALLLDLDGLQKIAGENQKERELLVQKGRQMTAEAAQETAVWLSRAAVDETIASLQQRCDGIVEDSLSYLNRKLMLDARQERIVKKILKSSLKRLLREPILELKQLDSPEQQEEYKHMLAQLFHFE